MIYSAALTMISKIVLRCLPNKEIEPVEHKRDASLLRTNNSSIVCFLFFNQNYDSQNDDC